MPRTSHQHPGQAPARQASKSAGIHPSTGGVRAPKRKSNAKKNLLKYQGSDELLIPKLTFQRVLKAKLHRDFPNDNLRVTKNAAAGFQDIFETRFWQLFKKAGHCMHAVKRVTCTPGDVDLTIKIEDWQI